MLILLENATVISLEHLAGSTGGEAPNERLFGVRPLLDNDAIYALEWAEEVVLGVSQFLSDRLATDAGQYFGTLTLRELATRWVVALQAAQE